MAARAGASIVFDFDDAVWIRYVSPANSYLSYLRFPGKTATICRLARHVMAGNARLRDYAATHNAHVSIVPTTIDTAKYRPELRRASGRPTIGWTGSFSTVRYLEVLKPVLERLRQRHDFRFVVVGGSGFEASGVEVEHRPWCSDSEVHDISDLDVGVMPLPDAPWEQGKCGLKALQYMALAIPTVVSPVGVNSTLVRNGENGLLAASTEDWEAALDRLLGDATFAARLGKAGRRTVEREFSAAVQAPRVASILASAAAR